MAAFSKCSLDKCMSKLLSLADLTGEVKQGQRETEKESERAREKMTESEIGGKMTQCALQYCNY